MRDAAAEIDRLNAELAACAENCKHFRELAELRRESLRMIESELTALRANPPKLAALVTLGDDSWHGFEREEDAYVFSNTTLLEDIFMIRRGEWIWHFATEPKP
jgi:hypothetical protein